MTYNTLTLVTIRYLLQTYPIYYHLMLPLLLYPLVPYVFLKAVILIELPY